MIKRSYIAFALMILLFLLPTNAALAAEEGEEEEEGLLKVKEEPILQVTDELPKQFAYESEYEFSYQEDGEKGSYVTGHSAGCSHMDNLVDLINETELNAMVIDVKDDYGDMMFDLESENELVQEFTTNLADAEELMETMQENDIYPIARIVVFKDSRLAEERPELSFTHDDDTVWENGRGENFVNPFSEDVWDYNIEIAKQAAKLGFKEIQFDYVRFPEGFENRADELNYTRGDYKTEGDDVQHRVNAVTDFVATANDELKPYG